MTEAVYDTEFVRRCATDECYRGELLSQAEFDRWLAHTKAELLRELRDSFRPGDGNPWVKYVRTVLTNRANRIESEG